MCVGGVPEAGPGAGMGREPDNDSPGAGMGREPSRSRADLFRASSICATVNGVSARPRPSLSFWEGRAGVVPPRVPGRAASGRTPVTSAKPTRLLLPGSGPGAEDRKNLSGKLRSGECLRIAEEGRARADARGACSYCSPSPGARPPEVRVPAISSAAAPHSAACQLPGARRAHTAR
jgi:hypothetical protein